MSTGTLGKISAILSLNTANFQRGCNESARDVRNFAGTIERNIRRASDSAQRSLGNILTPLQQLQASMRAAFDQRLSFQGFQGAIRDVEDLKRRLGSLNGRDIALALNISGEENITDLQQKLREISNRDIRIALQVGGEGGIEAGLRRLTQFRDELTQDEGFTALQSRIDGITAQINRLNAASEKIVIGPNGGGLAEIDANRQKVEELNRTLGELQQRRQRMVSERVGARIDFPELDELIAKSGRVDMTRIPTLMDRLGASQQAQSETRLTRLTALAEGISRPLEAAVADFARLDMAVQAGFMPALSAAQNATDALGNELRRTGDYGDDAFNRLERQVDQAIISMRQMRELAESVSGLMTGNEMAFQQPDLMASLTSARRFGARAAEAMPSLNASDRGDTIARLQLIRELGERSQIQQSELLNAQTPGSGVSAGRIAEIRRELEATRQQIDAIREEGEQVIPINVDTTAARQEISQLEEMMQRLRFAVTGNVQNFDQARQEFGRLTSQVGGLESGRSAFSGRLEQLGQIIDSGDVQQLQTARDLIADIQNSLSERRTLDLDAERANREAMELDRTLQQIREDADFVVLGRPQTMQQAQAELRRIVGTLGELNAAQRAAAGTRITTIIDAMAVGNLDLAIEELEQLRQEAAAGIQFNTNAQAVVDRIDSINEAWDRAVRQMPTDVAQIDAEFMSLMTRIGSLNIDQRLDLDPLIADFRNSAAAGEGLFEQFQRLLAIRGRFDQVTADQSNPSGPFGPPLPPGFGGDSRAGLGAAMGDSSRRLDLMRGNIVSVKSQLDQLPESLRSQFIPAIEMAEQRFRRLAAAPDATAAAISRAERRLHALQGMVGRASEASAFASNFGGRGTMGLNLGIDQKAIRGVGAQIEYLQGRLTGLSAQARGPVVAVMERVRQIIVNGMAQGTVGTQEYARSLRSATTELTRVAAAALNVKTGKLAEQLKRVGDVGRGAFGNMGLAIQQGIFAVDDFMSVTGGMDQRIRAMANNISQMFFLIGGTWKWLAAGVAVSATAQAVVGILKWTGATEKAEDRQRRLKLQLEATNNAIDRQRDLAKSLADAYSDMARSIREVGLSDKGREELRGKQPMEDLQRKQAERRLAGIEANDPAVGRRNADIANIDERLRTEENAVARRRLLRQREAAEGRRQAAIDTIEGRAETNARVAVRDNGGFDAAIKQQFRAREEVARQRAGATGAEADRLTREIAVIDNTIQRIRDTAQNVGFAGADRAAQAFGRAQQNISGLPGATYSETISRVNQARTERALTEFGRGKIDFDQLRRVISLQEEYGRATEQASIALKTFVEAMENAAGKLAKAVEDDATQAAEQSRRRANAVEAEFGAGDPRAKAARNDQKELEVEQRRVAAERAKIDDEMGRLRDTFERDALEGRGDPRAVAIARRLQEIDSALATLPTTDREVYDQNQMRLERERLVREQGQIFDAQAPVRGLAVRADRLDTENQRLLQRQREQRERADRGRELGLPPGAREIKEASEAIRDIAAARDRGDFGAKEAQDRARRISQDQMRSAAPAIFEMADAVKNAVMQGPSRQALEVSDVSTMEGQRELNRLLRGDDAAKNANLVELQKQNATLSSILDALRAEAGRMGIALEL